jgi:hypothetical protein
MSMQMYIKNMMAPLVKWALTHGVDYKDMALLLKPVYLEASKQLLAQGQAKGDASELESLAAISGLSTTDVKALVDHEDASSVQEQEHPLHRISHISQVVAAWLAKGLPKSLPVRTTSQSASEPQVMSFTDLVKETAKTGGWPSTYSMRLILQNMERRGLVRLENDHVVLRQAVGMNVIDDEVFAHFAGSVGDHIRACTQNMASSIFLEQSIQADELTQDAAWQLHDEVSQWWIQGGQHLIARATQIDAACVQEPKAHKVHRLRIGIFAYTDAQKPAVADSKAPPKPLGSR